MATAKQRAKTDLDQLGEDIGEQDSGGAGAQGLRITIAIENLGDDREDPPPPPAPEPTTVKSPIRDSGGDVEIAIPKVRLTGGKHPRLVFAITLEE